jgi:hypothetical protein
MIAMGYTHYWRSATDIPPDTWRAISDDVRKLGENFQGAEVEIDADAIVIEGTMETFVLERTAEDFGFCKTGLQSYDKLVCAALAVATERFPALSVSSDGFMQDDGGAWDNAINWASSTLGRDVPNPSGARAKHSRWGGGGAQNTGQGQSH